MYVLEDLWDGNLAPCEKPCPPSAEYNQLKRSLSEHYDARCAVC